MANEKNLIPQNKRTKSEQRRIASEGGKASAEARRERRALRDTMNILLSSPITDTKQFNLAVKMGFDMDDLDKSVLVVIALYKRAIAGDVQAIKELRSIIGEETGDSGQLEALIRGLKG